VGLGRAIGTGRARNQPVWFVPGTPVGAGGAFTSGLKELPPVGAMRFSVGVRSAVVEGVVVVLDGLSVSPPLQAVNTMAAKPSAAATPRYRELCMLKSDLSRGPAELTRHCTVQYSRAAGWVRVCNTVQTLCRKLALSCNYTRCHHGAASMYRLVHDMAKARAVAQ
jgi:hypothetical protein